MSTLLTARQLQTPTDKLLNAPEHAGGWRGAIISNRWSDNICTPGCVFCVKIYAVLPTTGASRARRGERVDSEATASGLFPHRVTHTEKLQPSSMLLFITGSTLLQAVITINKAKNRTRRVSVCFFFRRGRDQVRLLEHSGLHPATTSDHKQGL